MTNPVTLISRFTALALIAGFTVVAMGSPARAASSQSFQISPPTANYAGDPGSNVKATIKLTNLTDEAITLTVGKQNFFAKGEEGEIELTDNAAPLYSLAPWFVLGSSSITVPAKATKEVPYTISIPAGAEPGGRYGSIIFSTIPQKLPSGQSGASIQQTIAGIVFQRINGAANEKLEVANFTPSKSFYEYGPVKLTARVKNTGTVHEKPTGTITIKNMLGFKVASFPLDEHFVIPGSVRRLHNDWPTGKNQPFLMGRYTAELSAIYGSNQKLTASTSFTVLPWRLLSAILLVLIVIFLLFWRGRKRLRRAMRILAGKE